MSKEISPTDLSTILARLTWIEMQLGKFDNATEKERRLHRVDQLIKEKMESAAKRREQIKEIEARRWFTTEI